MTLSAHSKELGRKKHRPWLTATCERLLRCTLPSSTDTASGPLPTIPRRLLVVKVFGMGDSILVRSLLDKLLERHRDMQIGVLVGPTTREIMTNRASFQVHQYISHALSISSALQMLKDIRSCHYDAILNCEQRSLAGSAFLALTRVPYHIGFIPIAATPKGRFLTHALRFRDDLSVWQSFICLARLIDPGIPQTFLPTAPAVSEEAEQWGCGWWKEHIGPESAPTVALHVGSQDREFSRWPVPRFVEFAERMRSRNRGLSIVLTGTASEKELIAAFIRVYPGRAIDASESGSLLRTAALLKRCRLLVSNDTGIMHLGAALGVPTVGLFGPNSPRYWAPLGPRATYVYDTGVACSPCLNLYADRWPLECSHPEKGRCMLDIKVDSVMMAARRVIVGEWLN